MTGAVQRVEEARRNNESVKKAMEEAWENVREVRKYRRRRYAVAAAFTALGVFLLFLSLAILLHQVSMYWISPFWTFIILISLGSVSFGYGFYRMGVY